MLKITVSSSYVVLASLLLGQATAVASLHEQKDDCRSNIVIHAGDKSPVVVNIAFGQPGEPFSVEKSQSTFFTPSVISSSPIVSVPQVLRFQEHPYHQLSLSVTQPPVSSERDFPSVEMLMQASLREKTPVTQVETARVHSLTSGHSYPFRLPSFQAVQEYAGSMGEEDYPRFSGTNIPFTPLEQVAKDQKRVYLPSINTLSLGVRTECPHTLEGQKEKVKSWEELFQKIPRDKLTAYDLCAAAESYFGLSRHLQEGSQQFVACYRKIVQCYEEALKKEPLLARDIYKKIATGCIFLAQYIEEPQEKYVYACKTLQSLACLEKDTGYVKKENFYVEQASAHLIAGYYAQIPQSKAAHVEAFVNCMEKMLALPSEKTASTYVCYAQSLERIARQYTGEKLQRTYGIAAGFCDKVHQILSTHPEELTRELKRDLARTEMKAAQSKPDDIKRKILKRSYKFFKADVQEQHADAFSSFEAMAMIASEFADMAGDHTQKTLYLKKASDHLSRSFQLNAQQDKDVYTRAAQIQLRYAAMCPEEQKRDLYLKSALWFDLAQNGDNNVTGESYCEAATANMEVLRRTQEPHEQYRFAKTATEKYLKAFDDFSHHDKTVSEETLLEAGFSHMSMYQVARDIEEKNLHATQSLAIYNILFSEVENLSEVALMAIGHAYTTLGLFKADLHMLSMGIVQFEKLYHKQPSYFSHFYKTVQSGARYLADYAPEQYKNPYYERHAIWCDRSVQAGIEPYSYGGIDSYVQAGNWLSNPTRKKLLYDTALDRAQKALKQMQNPTSYPYCVIGDIQKRLGESYPVNTAGFYEQYQHAFSAYQKALELNTELTPHFYERRSLVQTALQNRL